MHVPAILQERRYSPACAFPHSDLVFGAPFGVSRPCNRLKVKSFFFNTIDRSFLMAVMERLGVGDGLLRWVRLLHTETRSAALVSAKRPLRATRTVDFATVPGGVYALAPAR